MLCTLFGFSTKAHYKKKKDFSALAERSELWRLAAIELRTQMPRIGARKLHYMIRARLVDGRAQMGRDQFFKLLRGEKMLVPRRKRYVVTTQSNHWMKKYPDLVKKQVPHRPDQLWVADITYIKTELKDMFLHLVTDAYSKRVMGYELCFDMLASSTLKALKMALAKRKYHDKPLIHHSDRGSQYCSKLYTDLLIEKNIRISMTQSGDPYENAVAERINGILKDEFGLGDTFKLPQHAIMQAHQGIRIYNNLRPHLSCQYLTPVQMHAQDKISLRTYRR
jgi:putative transposase